MEVDLNFLSQFAEIAPKTWGGWSKFEGFYPILLQIPPIVILFDRKNMLKIWRESADLHLWPLRGPK